MPRVRLRKGKRFARSFMSRLKPRPTNKALLRLSRRDEALGAVPLCDKTESKFAGKMPALQERRGGWLNAGQASSPDTIIIVPLGRAPGLKPSLF